MLFRLWDSEVEPFATVMDETMIPPGNASDAALPRRVEALTAVLNASRKYWPLTSRQIYYLMVEHGQAGRALTDYAEFTALLWSALREGRLPARSVWEPPQEIRQGGAWDNQDDFIRAEVEDLLWGYRRDLLQGQPRFVEVWLEKPELLDFFSAVTLDYCVSTVLCPRSPGLGFLNDLRRRLADLPPGRVGVPGQKPEVVALYFGDFDPDPHDHLVSLQESLRAEGGIWDVSLQRVALTRKLVLDRSLPARVRVSGVDEVIHPGTPPIGDDHVELEALEPKLLVSLLRRSVEAELDMALFQNQKEIQARELAALARLRADILRRVDDLLPGS
jgi:hypothetical protein